jgi:hypothetical protein
MGCVLGFITSPSAITSYPSSAVSTVRVVVNGSYTPQIAMTNNVIVMCNLVNSTMVPSATASAIYSFAPQVTSGQQIVSIPFNLMYFPVSDGRYSEIQLRLVDDYFQPLQLIDPAITATIVITQASSSS